MRRMSGRPGPATRPVLRVQTRYLATADATRGAHHAIGRAKADADLILTYLDFDVIDDDLYLDGLDPDNWIDAMIMEERV